MSQIFGDVVTLGSARGGGQIETVNLNFTAYESSTILFTDAETGARYYTSNDGHLETNVIKNSAIYFYGTLGSSVTGGEILYQTGTSSKTFYIKATTDLTIQGGINM